MQSSEHEKVLKRKRKPKPHKKNKTNGSIRKISIEQQINKHLARFNEYLMNNNINDNDFTDRVTRKEYSKSLWYNLQAFFNDRNCLNDADIKFEERLIDRKRKHSLNEFDHYVRKFHFTHTNRCCEHVTIENHLCSTHVQNCNYVATEIETFLQKWDSILSLFSSYATLEHYNEHFSLKEQEGRIFYGKLCTFQAWLSLHSEIYQCIDTLGGLISCKQCNMWPYQNHTKETDCSDHQSCLFTPTHGDTDVAQQFQSNTESSKTAHRRKFLRLNTLTPSSPLSDYYYRYIDDHVNYSQIELIQNIFRWKHGPLMQRLRFVFQEKQKENPSIFDKLFDYSVYLPSNAFSHNYLSDATPDKLMDELFALNKLLHDKTQYEKTNVNADTKSNHIFNRFHHYSTQTSNPTNLSSNVMSHNQYSHRLQSHFLDSLDPTSYPHLPGSTLFPSPIKFLADIPLNFHSQTTFNERIIIAKMLKICHRLYRENIWIESEQFGDMCSLHDLPSLYPQYVFLVHIPLDIMITWHQYHQDKMSQTSTPGALLLLIDECHVLIHNSILTRHYINLMIKDTFFSTDMKVIESKIIKYDSYIINTIREIINYIEHYIKILLSSNLFQNCILFLKQNWTILKKYSTMMNTEEMLAEKFLIIYSLIITRYKHYIDLFHSSIPVPKAKRIEYIKKKVKRKFQRTLTINILREAKAVYDDCAITIDIYLKKPPCKEFLTALKTAGFEKIEFASEKYYYDRTNLFSKDESSEWKHLFFVPNEHLKEPSTKRHIIQILSSSFRLSTHNNSSLSNKFNEEETLPSQCSNSSQQSINTSTDGTLPLLYVLCVPIPITLESSWRGPVHIVPDDKCLTSICPIYTSWKKTTTFLITQQTNNLDNVEQLFKERLSEGFQHFGLLYFETESSAFMKKRSCFEKVTDGIRNLSHSILSLTNTIISNVKNFEIDVEKYDVKHCIHMEEHCFSFAMDIIQETSFYATQYEHDKLKYQAENNLSLADAWLNFAQRKLPKTPPDCRRTLPMCLVPGFNFILHICSLQFANVIDNDLYSKFYRNLYRTYDYFIYSKDKKDENGAFEHKISSKPGIYTLVRSNSPVIQRKKNRKLTQIEKIDRLEKKIDHQRIAERIIGVISNSPRKSFASTHVQQELLKFKMRKFDKIKLVCRGQFATTYTCKVEKDGEEYIGCYKEYKTQHNDISAVSKIVEHFEPMMHIKHENFIRYHGINFEYCRVLVFMDYCPYGTLAQVLLGKLPLSNDISSVVDDDICRTSSGVIYFQENLVKIYLRQLLSALSHIHRKDITHRDIRNVNIFLSDPSKRSIKLGDINFVYDFKFMKKQTTIIDIETVHTLRESVVFYAPEIIKQGDTTTKSDIWSLGCTVLHMLTGKIPFSNSTIVPSVYYLRIIWGIADGVQPPIPTDFNLSTECIEFLKSCFIHEPHSRPSSDDLLRHSFLQLNST